MHVFMHISRKTHMVLFQFKEIIYFGISHMTYSDPKEVQVCKTFLSHSLTSAYYICLKIKNTIATFYII